MINQVIVYFYFNELELVYLLTVKYLYHLHF